MFAAIFAKVSALPLSDFFQYGGEGDTVIIDRENNIQLLSLDDGVLQIITPHIPFFDRIENTNVQVRALPIYILDIIYLSFLCMIERRPFLQTHLLNSNWSFGKRCFGPVYEGPI